MKNRLPLFFLFVLLSVQSATAQTTFFTDNFENSTGWTTSSYGSVNDWIIGTCENNGGVKAAYVSSGGSTNDCTPTGKDHYGYADALSGAEQTILYRTVDATCFQTITVLFDLKVEGEGANDYFELVTSIDNGSTWQLVTGGGPVSGMTSYTPQNIMLPASFDETTFMIGLRFTYNNSNSTAMPPSVDNFRLEALTSLDAADPVVVCPADFTRGSNAGCTYDTEDFGSLMTITDDCSSTFNTNQSPIVGTTLSSGPNVITYTAYDQSGNSGLCTFTLTVIDTIAPTAICPADGTVYGNFLCSADVGDQVQFASATDNCSISSAITLSQSPSDTTNFTGSTTVTITATDEAGNAGTCTFTLTITDTIAPVVTCMSDTLVNVSAPCNYAIPDLSATHSAIDHCTPNNLLSFSQNPVAGTMVSGVLDIVITYLDTAGNSGTCITHVSANDTQAPSITCPGTQTTNLVSCTTTAPDFSSLATASDNCSLLTFSQTPAVGSIVQVGHYTVTLTATDDNGNSQSCTFQYNVLENVAPQITCPPNQVVCNPLVNYASPSATDNCLFLMTQTDGTGFTDGSVFPVGITTQTYTVIDTSGNTASCSFTIEVQDYPDTAQVVSDTILLCNVFDATVDALPIQSGTGSWAVISGTGTLTNPTALSSGITGLSLGENKVQWIVTSTNCGQRRDTVVIIVSDYPTTANLQDTTLVCMDNGSIIQANLPTSGTGTWYCYTDGIQFSNIHAPVVQVYDVPEGYSQIHWIISTPGCPASADSTIVYHPATATIFQADTSLCIEAFPFALVGTTVGPGQFGSWTVDAGFATLSSSSTNNTSITSADPGMVTIVYKLSHPTCGHTTDTLVLSLSNCENAFSDVPTVFTPNGDGQNDVFNLGNLNDLHPDCEVIIVNRYGTVVYQSTGYADPWDGTFNDEPLPFGTYFYSVSSPTEEFEAFTGSISIIR